MKILLNYLLKDEYLKVIIYSWFNLTYFHENGNLNHIDVFSNSGIDNSHSFPTSTSSCNTNPININVNPIQNANNNVKILSTNINLIVENIDCKSFDIELWNKILNNQDITPIDENETENKQTKNIKKNEIQLKLLPLDIAQLIPSTDSSPLNTK